MAGISQQFYALTSRGLGYVLEAEIRRLGFQKTSAYQGGVLFEADWEGCYLANLSLRSASRILLPLMKFKATTGEELYKKIFSHDFTQYIEPTQTLSVEASVKDSEFKDQRFVALKVKDAIVDQFRDKFGIRPDVDKKTAALHIWVRVLADEVMVALDTSGDALFKRGYRVENVEAPVKEHVAAGLLLMTDWNGEGPIVDPMCGSGTFLLEGALMASHIVPGVLRKSFGFQKLKNFDAKVFEALVDKLAEKEIPELPFKFFGFDKNFDAVTAARKNTVAAGLDHLVEIQRSQVSVLEPPCEKGMVIVNPPYGERLETDEAFLKDAYLDLAFALKTRFKGWPVWILSPRKDLLHHLGFRPSKRFQVWNGPLQCEFVKYEVFRS